MWFNAALSKNSKFVTEHLFEHVTVVLIFAIVPEHNNITSYNLCCIFLCDLDNTFVLSDKLTTQTESTLHSHRHLSFIKAPT